jgi:organic hydroperoxide reductase OsmC/OhrA
MKPFPHVYEVAALAEPEGEVLLSGSGLEVIRSAPPIEFDGPGDRWSPETLLVAAMADCLVLTFRAIARASKLPWEALDVRVTGTLAREAGNSRFTRFDVAARLRVAPGADRALAERLLHKAEAGCLVSNSLSGERHLAISIDGGASPG